MGRIDCSSLEFFWLNLTREVCRGKNLLFSLSRIRDETTSPALAEAVRTMMANIESGDTVTTAMRKTSVFPEHVLLLVDGGERSGILHRVFVLILEHVWRCPDCMMGDP